MNYIKFYSRLWMLCLTLVMASCAKDNYAPPSSAFTGRIVYQGTPLGTEDGQVYFELWQPGFGKSGSINVAVAQDGSYSAMLFNGSYKLVLPGGQGAFMGKNLSNGIPDTLQLDISGNKSLDLEVTPYYMIRNQQITASGKTITATCALEKIITDANAKNIERVSLYINKTQFVAASDTRKIANADLGGGAITDMNNISLSVAVPDIQPTQNYVFARIGVKIAGVEDMLYGPLQKITF
ncbi:DUF3823 domain-containing protein [Niabella drilacis]|uniref:DUF3823 domain-containing protein n=1 Tax=Niabella drilacis (strain DSM 25811 / CCM 8410 / CCUG 62505 / LMG 26954 / E90) TaxID=1285928 RepID=A0A1G6TZG8_NIADE|nr:DUF3823 domain-containing protein [Niabella drilacis]SDD33747.1 Protein of unknown function [Niabella drilacis]